MDLHRHRLYVRVCLCSLLIVYQIGGLITGEVSFGIGTGGRGLVVGIVYLLFRKNKYEDERLTIRSVDARRTPRRPEIRKEAANERTHYHRGPHRPGGLCGHRRQGIYNRRHGRAAAPAAATAGPAADATAEIPVIPDERRPTGRKERFMELSQAHLRYLLAIGELSQGRRRSAPPRWPGSSGVRPSVTRMLAVLAEGPGDQGTTARSP
ncbi:MAG: hypothetical protein ACLTYN_00355 [Dysosmobacter welbionis]